MRPYYERYPMTPNLAVSKFLLFVLCLALGAPAWAADIGRVIQLMGTVSAQKNTGAIRVLSFGAGVSAGDMITTEKNSVIRIALSDGGQLSLRPESRLNLEAYQFQEAAPQQDSMVFKLVKGGLRAVTGSIGKRGNANAYQAKATQATIGIRGTRFGVLDCRTLDGDPDKDQASSCLGLLVNQTKDKNLAPADGLYIDVTEGAIALTNSAGTFVVNSGEVSYVGNNNRLPVLLKEDPGLKEALPSDLLALPSGYFPLGGNSNLVCEVR